MGSPDVVCHIVPIYTANFVHPDITIGIEVHAHI